MLNATKLNSQINEFRFLLRGSNFVEKKITQFSSEEDAKDFLIKFLVVECLAGMNYSYAELLST